MATAVDFTKMRLSKRARIARCPKCGRRGEVMTYVQRGKPNGGRCFHKGNATAFGLIVTDACYWTQAECAELLRAQ